MSVCDICGAEVYKPKVQLHKAWHEAHDIRWDMTDARYIDLSRRIDGVAEQARAGRADR